MNKNTIHENEIADIFAALSAFKNIKTGAKQSLEGISFRYKTVQYHLVDDLFEEIARNNDIFGDAKIYAERFSLPGYGKKNQYLTGEEYQYEIVIGIEPKATLDAYHTEMQNVLNAIEKKHGVDIYSEPYEEIEGYGYNIHKIIFYTTKEDIFPRE
jgi:hypothetical protein